MQTIDRNQLVQKMDRNEDFELIDVLPQESFQHYHIPGARNIPINSENFEDQIQQTVPEKDKEIVVYCKDQECPASPQAAEKLESMGYTNVYDYEAGKEDWRHAGLQVET